MDEKLKVLIVDDSRIFRGLVEEVLSKEAEINIVGSVRNGVKAMEFIAKNPPDMVTLDIEMPDMDGLETLEAINKLNDTLPDYQQIGAVMLSALTRRGAEITIKALELGAFDFITKPDGPNLKENLEFLERQLVVKIKTFAAKKTLAKRMAKAKGDYKESSAAKPSALSTPPPSISSTPSKATPSDLQVGSPVAEKKIAPQIRTSFKAIAIGVSTGGPKALMQLLPELTKRVHLPILIVQHMPPTFTASLAANLDRKCHHKVVEAKAGDMVEDYGVYIAPGGLHMLVRKSGSDNWVIGTNENPPESGCRPAADVLFRSVAASIGKDVLAVVLTGMGKDGCKGSTTLKKLGAYILIQDEASSVVWGMPGSVHGTGDFDKMVSLNKMAETIEKVVKERRG